PLVNPGAFEVPDNMIDDDCNGQIDDKPLPCTAAGGGRAFALAAALDLCGPWLLDATLEADPMDRDDAIVSHFGVVGPKQGADFALFSTGIAGDETAPGFVPPQPGTALGMEGPNPLVTAVKNLCTGKVQQSPPTVNDAAILTLKIQVPTNAKSFGFQFDFYD